MERLRMHKRTNRISIICSLAITVCLILSFIQTTSANTDVETDTSKDIVEEIHDQETTKEEVQETTKEDTPKQTLTEVMNHGTEVISFSGVINLLEDAIGFQDVDVILSINDTTSSITLPSGMISETMISYTLPDKCEYQKAVVRNQQNQDTEIVRIAKLGDKVYYSLEGDEDTGILLKATEQIIILCSTVYSIQYDIYSTGILGGTVTGPDKVLLGEDLDFYITPNKYVSVESVQFIIGTSHYPAWTVDENNHVTMASNNINNDVIVIISFVQDLSYRVTSSSSTISGGHVCGECSKTYADNNSSTIGAISNVSSDRRSFDITPAKTTAIYLYSQAWSGGGSWYLNRLMINEEDVNVPMSYDIGDSAETILSNGSKVTILLEASGTSGKDPHETNTANRCKYLVLITDASEDMVISANFKSGNDREIIFKGLNGILDIGASAENITVGIGFDYTLRRVEYKVFEAYYKEYYTGAYDSKNVYAYKVSPGYNPYTVSIGVYYNGVYAGDTTVDAQPGQLATDIADMYTSSLLPRRTWSNFKSATVGYYGFSLVENAATNQVCYFNANPYQYQIQYRLNGGNISSIDTSLYTTSNDGQLLTENNTYTLLNGETTTKTPTNIPTRAGYVFMGWRLNTAPSNTTTYKNDHVFRINETTIEYAEGDKTLDTGHTFTFEAVWMEESEADLTYYTVYYYKEDPIHGNIEVDNKKYTLIESSLRTGPVGSEVVLLNDNYVGEGYRLNHNISTIQIEELIKNNEQNNRIICYYDLDLEIEKDTYINGSLTKDNGTVDQLIEVQIGDQLTYKITITNPTSDTIALDSNAIVADIIPSGLDIEELNGATQDNQKITWQLDSNLAPNSSKTFVVTTKVSTGGTFINQATVSLWGEGYRQITSNSTYHQTVGYNLTIHKIVSGEYGDLTKQFELQIELYDGATPITGSYSYIGISDVNGVVAPQDGVLIFNENGQASIVLSHGQGIEFPQLPSGIQYTIKEVAVEGYDVIYNAQIIATGITSELNADTTIVVNGINSGIVDTGIDNPYNIFGIVIVLLSGLVLYFYQNYKYGKINK